MKLKRNWDRLEPWDDLHGDRLKSHLKIWLWIPARNTWLLPMNLSIWMPEISISRSINCQPQFLSTLQNNCLVWLLPNEQRYAIIFWHFTLPGLLHNHPIGLFKLRSFACHLILPTLQAFQVSVPFCIRICPGITLEMMLHCFSWMASLAFAVL
jgi:hypothetical protein